MKKVLILIDSLEAGGAEKELYTLLRYLDKQKYMFTIVPIVDSGVYASKIKSLDGVNYHPLLTTKSGLFNYLLYVLKYKLIYSLLPAKWSYKLFVPKGHDIEIAFCEGFVTKLVSHSSNIRAYKIAWVHTDLVLNNWPLQLKIYRSEKDTTRIYESFDKVVGVSRAVCSGLSSEYDLKNVVLIYNMLDKAEILRKASLKNSNESQMRSFRVVSVGRLTSVKGFDRLVLSIWNLKSHNKDISIRLTIVGDGENREELEKLINDLDLTDCVDLVGYQYNPYIYMADADVFVCSSRYEGFSLAIAEAMILGLPILTTNCIGPAELVAQGQYGFLVDNTQEGLNTGLEIMFNNPEIRKRYKARSIERSLFFKSELVISQINDLLNYER